MLEWSLPIRGISNSTVPDKELEGTSAYMNNVRPYDVLDSRLRLGQRPGLDKWGEGTQIGSEEQPVVAITAIRTVV